MKLRQTGKILQNFLNALQKQLCDHLDQQSKHMLWELEQLKPVSYEKITASNCPTCSYLEYALSTIPKDLAPLDVLAKALANQVVWHEASRGVPDLFKGGYAFAEVIGKQGLMQSDSIRLGLFLQKPDIDYPLHAHDADELYLILSGNASWQIEDLEFRVGPGSIVHHHTSEAHATFTDELPIFAVWIWTGMINGRYWFSSHSEKDCPPDY